MWSFDDSDEFEFFNRNRDKLLEQNRKWFKEFSHKKTYWEGYKRLDDEEDRISRKRQNQEDKSRHNSFERCQKVKSYRDHSKSHKDKEEVKKTRGGSKVRLDGAATHYGCQIVISRAMTKGEGLLTASLPPHYFLCWFVVAVAKPKEEDRILDFFKILYISYKMTSFWINFFKKNSLVSEPTCLPFSSLPLPTFLTATSFLD